ncbi:MAG: GbsR/MarR family transcriptional regulator [Chthoniobacterales bacterium]
MPRQSSVKTPAKSAKSAKSDSSLSGFDARVLELFSGVSRLLGMPPSLGAIYGLLFVSTEPLPMDRLIDRLKISKGGASMGLRQLREVGAVKVVKIEGDRRDHYLAELELRRLVRSLLKERVLPHLERGAEELSELQKLISDLPRARREHVNSRLGKLKSWHRKADDVLPIAMQLLRD